MNWNINLVVMSRHSFVFILGKDIEIIILPLFPLFLSFCPFSSSMGWMAHAIITMHAWPSSHQSVVQPGAVACLEGLPRIIIALYTSSVRFIATMPRGPVSLTPWDNDY